MSAPEANPPPPLVPPDAAATQVVDRKVDVTSISASAKVGVKVPASWTTSELSVVLRDEFQEAIAGVQFTVVCNANCGDVEIAGMQKVVDDTVETRTRPNRNTGDASLDAVRLNAEVVEQGDVPDGKFRVVRITKPAGLTGPYREQLYAVCVRAKKPEKVIAAQAWAPLVREQELGPLVVNACKTFEIL